MVQVTDFGASKAVETGRDMTLNVGTVAYVHNPSLHPRLPLALSACPLLAGSGSICSARTSLLRYESPLLLAQSVNALTNELILTNSLPQCVRSYMPPEVMQQFQDDVTAVALDGPKCDVFSFAVLAIYAVTGVSPHDGLNNNDIFVKVSACIG